MSDNSNQSGPPLTRKKRTPAFKAECARQVAAGFFMSRYQFIEQVACIEPVQVLCRRLQVSAAAY